MNVTRRAFLQGAGAAVGAATLSVVSSTSKKVYALDDFTGYPDRFGMLTDTTMCVGCRACETACNRVNKLPPPEKRFADPTVFDTERRTTPDSWTVVNQYPSPVVGGQPIYRKVQCMHCEEPACVSACLVGALKKTPEGAVIYKEDVCIGCRYCMNACPFNMPTFEYDDPFSPAIRKCTLCYSRIKENGGVPACASACPIQATMFGKRSDLLDIARKRINSNTVRYVNQIYGEREVGGTGWLYLSAVPFEKIGMPVNVGTQPYPEFTRDWLLTVPIVLLGWPSLLVGLNALSKRREKLAIEAVRQEEKDKEVR